MLRVWLCVSILLAACSSESDRRTPGPTPENNSDDLLKRRSLSVTVLRGEVKGWCEFHGQMELPQFLGESEDVPVVSLDNPDLTIAGSGLAFSWFFDQAADGVYLVPHGETRLHKVRRAAPMHTLGRVDKYQYSVKPIGPITTAHTVLIHNSATEYYGSLNIDRLYEGGNCPGDDSLSRMNLTFYLQTNQTPNLNGD